VAFEHTSVTTARKVRQAAWRPHAQSCNDGFLTDRLPPADPGRRSFVIHLHSRSDAQTALAVVIGMVIVPAAACVLAWLGVWSVDATVTPPAWERAFARMAVSASVARHAPRTPNPLRASPDVLLAGMKVYRERRLDSLPPSIDAAGRSVGG